MNEEMDKRVKLVKLTPLSIRKDYLDDDDKSDFGLLQWSIRAGYPRITVFISNIKKPNRPSGMDYDNMLTAPLDYITYGIFSNYLKNVIASEKPIKYMVDCFNIKFENNVKTDEIYLQSKITVGKDNDGVIYLAVTVENKRKLKFDLLPSKWYKFFNSDGVEITDKGILSVMYAKAYHELLNKLVYGESTSDAIKTNFGNTPTSKYSEISETSIQNTTQNSQISKSNDGLSDLDDIF